LQNDSPVARRSRRCRCNPCRSCPSRSRRPLPRTRRCHGCTRRSGTRCAPGTRGRPGWWRRKSGSCRCTGGRVADALPVWRSSRACGAGTHGARGAAVVGDVAGRAATGVLVVRASHVKPHAVPSQWRCRSRARALQARRPAVRRIREVVAVAAALVLRILAAAVGTTARRSGRRCRLGGRRVHAASCCVAWHSCSTTSQNGYAGPRRACWRRSNAGPSSRRPPARRARRPPPVTRRRLNAHDRLLPTSPGQSGAAGADHHRAGSARATGRTPHPTPRRRAPRPRR